MDLGLTMTAASAAMGPKVHMAVDTLGHLLVVHVTPANEQERDQVDALCQAVQQATGSTVEKAWVDQGYTGQRMLQRKTASPWTL